MTDSGGVDGRDGYTGPAVLRVDERDFDVRVILRGFFHPTAGRYQWYGRIAADERLSSVLRGRKQTATLRTPAGQAEATLSEPDLWDRYRVVGYSTPPFPVETDPGDQD